jgi:hypothetical protein
MQCEESTTDSLPAELPELLTLLVSCGVGYIYV